MTSRDAGEAPVLVGCSHGTADPVGQGAVAALLADVRAARPGVTVTPAFVDVQEPAVGDVVRDLAAAGRRSVVVPLLLSTGYHTRVDVARAVESVAGRAVAAPPLGPDDRLTGLLRQRLDEAGAADADGVVVAAAGSSDPQAARDVEQVVEGLRRRRGGPVLAGYGASASPSVTDAVARLRRDGCRRVVVAAYLLAPGFFHARLAQAGADAVTAPLAPDPALTAIVQDRYDAAVARLR